MGGIGKTTLTKKIYKDKSIKSHFDIQAWITVSQSYSLNDILQRLLQSLNQPHDPTGEQSESFELKEKVRKLLLGMRYLIVIDDIRNTEAWDGMQICFPKQSMGSRILLTTRLTYVATHASSGGVPYIMSTLSEEESWDLFCNKVFKKESFPPRDEFKKIGKDIVMKCKGLPLAVIVIAGILSKAKLKVEDWQNIAKYVKVALSSISYEEQNCEKILSLSYNHLSDDLKTCFLYLGVFPEDYEILVRRLVGYWAAGEFLEVEEGSNNREEVAWQRLQDLIDKNLVLVEKRGVAGRMKTCKVHDLTREMCLKLAKAKNILHVIDDKFEAGQTSRELIRQENGYFWVSLQSFPEKCIHISRLGFEHSSLHNCHSFLAMLPYPYESRIIPILHYKLFRSIKVLDLLQLYLIFFPSPSEINNLHQLRYLALYTGVSPLSFSILNSLNKLQTFIWRTRECKVVKLSIPNTSQLMQLSILYSSFHFTDGEENLMSLEKLTSVAWLSDLCCTNKELMMRIPNVKKLGVRYTEGKSVCREHPINLIHILSYLLHQLENISFHGPEFTFSGYKSMSIPKSYNFSPKLNKLTFYRTRMKWEIMTILGRLPNLEVLQLKVDAFLDYLKEEWEQTEMGFPKLKVLAFKDLTLHLWVDSRFFFPKLECLMIHNCRLRSLPYKCLSESPCLKLIDLEHCEKSVSISANRLRDDGDGQIEVRIKHEWFRYEEARHY